MSMGEETTEVTTDADGVSEDVRVVDNGQAEDGIAEPYDDPYAFHNAVRADEDDDEEQRAGELAGVYNAKEVVDFAFDELHLPPEVADLILETWNTFIRNAESREAAGDAIFSSLFETAPSLQSLFKTARAVMVLRFMTGLNNIIQSLRDPRAMKTIVETMGFQHLDFEVTVPRVTVFRDSLVELLTIDMGSHFTYRALDGWCTLLNYIGGAYIYVRVKYADRLRILATSWATANNKKEEAERLAAEKAAEEAETAQEGADGGYVEKGVKQEAEGSGEGSGEDNEQAVKNTSVPTSFNEMFTFNAAVMGFASSQWMNEVLSSFDNIVTNVSNTYRLQEECDVLGLRIAKYSSETINLSDYKAVMLASLRSLVPKDWNSAHEVAWSWLWENVERMIKALMGKPAIQEQALQGFFGSLLEEEHVFMRREVYVQFFALAPAGQDHFKQSTTRLHFISGKVVMMTLDMFKDPKQMVDTLSAIGLRHAGYGIPTDLFGPYVSACDVVMRSLTTDETARDAFRWSLSLISRIMMRVINEGSTIVMKAINMNSAKQLKKAVACAPRGKRAMWMLNVQVGTQSISPLLWAIETGALDAAQAIIMDLLTIRADRDRYYYGMDDLFERHPDIIRRLCMDAPVLVPVLLDGLIWRSRTTENGRRRVNYYIKHLVVDSHGEFSKAIEWVSETSDPKLVRHPVLSLVTDIVWSQVAFRSFLFGKTWFLFTLLVFITSQSILNRMGSSGNEESVERPFQIRVAILCCRLFIYIFSSGHWFFYHLRNIMTDIAGNSLLRWGRLAIPAYLNNWQDTASLCLTVCLVAMLLTEPILHCMQSDDAALFAELCPHSEGILVPYSIVSTAAMLLYFILLIDLSVFSTRISAFALVCFRVLSEVGLFLFGLFFLVVAFASAISSLDQDLVDFAGLPASSVSLFKISFGMLDGHRYDAFQENPAVLGAIFLYVVATVVFLLNLLVAQLNCAYQATFQDMLGYARLNRGKIVTETMPSVPKRRWEAFVAGLRLDANVEFGEGDIGIPGGFQLTEPASANITTTDMIKRYGGSTSPAAQWPEEELLGDEDLDRFDRMEKYIERAVKRATGGKASKGSKTASSGLRSGTAGSSNSNGERSMSGDSE